MELLKTAAGCIGYIVLIEIGLIASVSLAFCLIKMFKGGKNNAG